MTLADAVDVARGDVFASPDRPPHVADQFACHLVWMHDAPMLPGRPYLLQLGTATMTATVTELKHRIDVETGVHEATKQLALNEIGFANIALDRSAPFDGYDENRDTGGFILIDRTSNATVGAGMIRFPLRCAAPPTCRGRFSPSTRKRAHGSSTSAPASCGSPASPGRGNRRSPTASRSGCWHSAAIPIPWTATTSGTASTGTWASPMLTGWRMSGA